MRNRFGPFTYDAATRQLLCGAAVVHLSPKAFQLLGVLLELRPNAVSKADLHQRLWPDTFVSDGNLAVLIAEIRRALGDSGRQPSFVRTVSRFGYAFVDLATDVASAPGHDRGTAVCAVMWNGEWIRLKTGENVVGRDATADVCIDAVGVSRRHALIFIAGDSVTLRDLSSKNGTFANGMRVIGPVRLCDDTEIRLGAVSVHFRRSAGTAPTQTISSAYDRIDHEQ